MAHYTLSVFFKKEVDDISGKVTLKGTYSQELWLTQSTAQFITYSIKD